MMNYGREGDEMDILPSFSVIPAKTFLGLDRSKGYCFTVRKAVTPQYIEFFELNENNLQTNISNNKIGHSVNGNTNTVYINPINSLKFVLNKIKKDKINLKKNFYVFTGSTVGVVPILKKGIYKGKIYKIGIVQTKII